MLIIYEYNCGSLFSLILSQLVCLFACLAVCSSLSVLSPSLSRLSLPPPPPPRLLPPAPPAPIRRGRAYSLATGIHPAYRQKESEYNPVNNLHPMQDFETDFILLLS